MATRCANGAPIQNHVSEQENKPVTKSIAAPRFLFPEFKIPA
jgi:hypothetical protein